MVEPGPWTLDPDGGGSREPKGDVTSTLKTTPFFPNIGISCRNSHTFKRVANVGEGWSLESRVTGKPLWEPRSPRESSWDSRSWPPWQLKAVAEGPGCTQDQESRTLSHRLPCPRLPVLRLFYMVDPLIPILVNHVKSRGHRNPFPRWPRFSPESSLSCVLGR